MNNNASRQVNMKMGSQTAALKVQQSHNLLPAMPFRRVKSNSLRVLLITDPPGVIEVPGLRNTLVSIHVGPSVQVSCCRGGHSHQGLAVHGDIDIIPAGTPSLWEIKDKDTALVLSLSPELLQAVAEEFDFDLCRTEIKNRFQVRDSQLENIGWALKAEMESGYPCGNLYIDSLAVSVATRLLRCHSSAFIEPEKQNGRLAGRRLKEVLSYIEDNLSQDISLNDIAAVVGLSTSYFKSLFRESVGLPVHQYLIRRRVERAKQMLGENELSISQIALEVGFAHQSHLAHHMRRLLGVSPKALRETLR
jgi:AraC family transcriptional regulator